MIAKLLEAVGIASTMLGLVQGLYGDMWGELYLFIGGIAVFVIGRVTEKKWESARKAGEGGSPGQRPADV
jgi:hypothetical protein